MIRIVLNTLSQCSGKSTFLVLTHVQIESVKLILLHQIFELPLQPRSAISVGDVQHPSALHGLVSGQRRHVVFAADLSDLRETDADHAMWCKIR